MTRVRALKAVPPLPSDLVEDLSANDELAGRFCYPDRRSLS